MSKKTIKGAERKSTPAVETPISTVVENNPTTAADSADSVASSTPVLQPQESPGVSYARSLQKDASENLKTQRSTFARAILQSYLEEDEPLLAKYNVLILHDSSSIIQNDADAIYRAIVKFQTPLPILLVINSRGGEIGPAYLISKLCREYANGKFVVAVPRQAKSAATLICCGADEVHMGSLSELGPVDPQINNLPTLGLKNSIEHISELVGKFPSATEMFASYLSQSMSLIHLGYYERVAESAKQYAERLLSNHIMPLKNDASEIAEQLVYAYKDHGFVIDKAEAVKIFGDPFIKVNTPEYDFANRVYEALSYMARLSDIFDHNFAWIGSRASECIVWEKKK